MNLRSNLAIGALLILALTVAAIQGRRVNALMDAESLYRWLLNSATQTRLGLSLEFEESSEFAEAMDDELYAKASALAEQALSNVPIDEEEDYDAQGELFSALIRAARLELDEEIWAFTISEAAAELRKDYLQYRLEGRLQSLGTQISTADIYGQDEQVYGVGVTSLFFGFRKIAANFLWLQVDKFWHQGQFHRMVPLMRTCVTLDSTFVDAYLLGAWHMGYNIPAKLPETPEPLKEWHPKYKVRVGLKEEWYYIASDFLKDGIRKNPRDYRLYFDLGYAIYEIKLDDHANAVRYLDEAIRHRHDQWVPRMLYLALMRNAQYEDAIEGWIDYLKIFPENVAGQRFVQVNRGLLAETISQEATRCARAAENAAKRLTSEATQARAANEESQADSLDAQAQQATKVADEMGELSVEELQKALAIWNALNKNTKDSLATARIQRFIAIGYANEGRYLEAISELEVARWDELSFFNEATALILDIKLEAGYSLSVSEQLFQQREMEAAPYREEVIQKPRVECVYEADLEPTRLPLLPPLQGIEGLV